LRLPLATPRRVNSFVSLEARDDAPTVCAISLLSAILSNLVHEGLGHAATALLTGTKSGLLTTVAWSSDFDSRLVAAGGTLANLAASIVFWIALRNVKSASVRWRFFLPTSFAFNLFEGTGYFLFSGVTNFGDWAQVIAGLHAHWLWRPLLVIVGMVSYFGAVLAVGSAIVRISIPSHRLSYRSESTSSDSLRPIPAFFLFQSPRNRFSRRSYLVLWYFLLPLHPHASTARL
jgi:hypothetical protein